MGKEIQGLRRVHGGRKRDGGSCGEMDFLGPGHRDLSGPGETPGDRQKKNGGI